VRLAPANHDCWYKADERHQRFSHNIRTSSAPQIPRPTPIAANKVGCAYQVTKIGGGEQQLKRCAACRLKVAVDNEAREGKRLTTT